MTRKQNPTHSKAPPPPIRFERHSVRLRAAIDGILSKPKPDDIHDLRSTLRRISAELRLLPASTQTTKQIARFTRLTRPIIRAAGKVRDLDVHADLLKKLPARLQPESDELARHIGKKRRCNAKRLRQLLRDDHKELLSVFAKLQAAPVEEPDADPDAAPAESASSSTGRDLARETFGRAATVLDLRQSDQLHELRKAARDARYLAESNLKSTGKDSAAAHDAARFQGILRTVGEWHDYLTLAESARRYLDAKSPLIQAIERLRDRHHRAALKNIQLAIGNGDTPA